MRWEVAPSPNRLLTPCLRSGRQESVSRLTLLKQDYLETKNDKSFERDWQVDWAEIQSIGISSALSKKECLGLGSRRCSSNRNSWLGFTAAKTWCSKVHRKPHTSQKLVRILLVQTPRISSHITNFSLCYYNLVPNTDPKLLLIFKSLFWLQWDILHLSTGYLYAVNIFSLISEVSHSCWKWGKNKERKLWTTVQDNLEEIVGGWNQLVS